MGKLMGTSGIKGWIERLTPAVGTTPAGHEGPAQRGAAAETRALHHLEQQGLALVTRNYRVARGPSARGGEVDLIMSAPDGTLVFVEVRARRSPLHGGAAASVSAKKRARIVLAAQHYLLRYRSPPPCRFDLIAIDGEQLSWLCAAFDAS